MNPIRKVLINAGVVTVVSTGAVGGEGHSPWPQVVLLGVAIFAMGLGIQGFIFRQDIREQLERRRDTRLP